MPTCRLIKDIIRVSHIPLYNKYPQREPVKEVEEEIQNPIKVEYIDGSLEHEETEKYFEKEIFPYLENKYDLVLQI